MNLYIETFHFGGVSKLNRYTVYPVICGLVYRFRYNGKVYINTCPLFVPVYEIQRILCYSITFTEDVQNDHLVLASKLVDVLSPAWLSTEWLLVV